MPNQRNNMHSDAVQEIISYKPGFIIRWGSTFFLILMCLIIIACWLIKYPDIVQAKAILTTINAPKQVVSIVNGKLVKLTVTENEKVFKNQVLGFIESTANHQQVILLSQCLDSIQLLLENNQPQLLNQYFHNNFLQLGELQPLYQIFSQTFLVFKNYLSEGFYIAKKVMLAKDMIYLKRLHTILFEQATLNEQDLALTQKTFDANLSLKEDNVISELDYRNEKSKLIGKQLTLPQIHSSIIGNESQQNEKQKEIAELENTINQQKIIFEQALNTFKSQVDDWKRKYFLTAPVEGRVSFSGFVQENQQLQSNQIVCFVKSGNSQYFAQLFIPQTNFGKVSIGQKVLLKFPSYPFQEYGALAGKIDFISHIPSDSGYAAKIILDNELQTTYRKQIQYVDGLTAQGEIITKDLRLLERVYYNFKNLIKR